MADSGSTLLLLFLIMLIMDACILVAEFALFIVILVRVGSAGVIVIWTLHFVFHGIRHGFGWVVMCTKSPLFMIVTLAFSGALIIMDIMMLAFGAGWLAFAIISIIFNVAFLIIAIFVFIGLKGINV